MRARIYQHLSLFQIIELYIGYKYHLLLSTSHSHVIMVVVQLPTSDGMNC